MTVKRKVLISIIFIIVILFVCIIMYMRLNPKVPVICYHNIATQEEKNNFPEEADWIITVENFEEHLQYLKKHHYKTLTTQEFYEWKQGKIELPYKSVLITFDDGFLSNEHYAFPLLKKYDIKATVFTVGNFIENSTETEWTGNVKTYMSKEILEKVKEEYPNIEISSHSYNLHYESAINQDISALREDIQAFNQNITQTKAYCYPFGQFNENMIQALKQENCEIAFRYGPTSKEYRKATRKDDNYQIPRLNASHGMDVKKFGLRLIMPF